MQSTVEVGAPVSVPRLSRHSFELEDGHRIGVAVAGRGVPLVVVHGFTAEGFLYAQTLNRLVGRGFKVIAIDMAGHGGTEGLPGNFSRMSAYSDLMSSCIEQLGIRRAVLAGHSMGGRVVAGVGASHPDQAVALLLIDAIVGDPWDRLVGLMRLAPPAVLGLGVALTVDTASTLPILRDRSQAAKLWNLVGPTVVTHTLQPWKLISPAASILLSKGSRSILDELGRTQVPTFVFMGDRDAIVPPCTAASAARRSGGQLIRVHGAGHSWLLKDPETLPAIVDELLEGRLGEAIRASMPAAGAGSLDDLEEHFYEPDAPILELSPTRSFRPGGARHRAPRYRWTISDVDASPDDPAADPDADDPAA